MALAKGTNSYATVDEADLYFADRLDVAAWEEANAIEKAKALVTATACLDEMTWVGSAVSASQQLAFPREGTYFDPKLGMPVNMSGVPDRIVKATVELAYHLLNNDGLLDETGGVTDLQISTISLTKVRSPDRISPTVRRLVAPLLLGQGSYAWWRAN